MIENALARDFTAAQLNDLACLFWTERSTNGDAMDRIAGRLWEAEKLANA